MVNATALVLSLLATGLPRALAAAECRQALVLALDVSSSVSAEEDALQRGGLAAALIAPEVERALFASPLPVAIAAYEWSGRDKQVMLADWQMIRNRADLLDLAEIIGRSSRSETEFPTALGYALGYGAGVLARGPDCLFATLDMAGDGANNEGFPPDAAYAEFPFAGVTVNGMVVNAPDDGAEIDLIAYYRAHVLHGPGAFLEVAQGFADYERAMRRKLLRELEPPAFSALGLSWRPPAIENIQ